MADKIDDLEHIAKVAEHKEEIALIENLLSEDEYKTVYRAWLKGIKTRPTKMAEKIVFAFDEIYTKNQTGKAEKKVVLEKIDDKDAERVLYFLEKKYRKLIESEGDYFVLGEGFRETFKISHEHKTQSERIKETLAEALKNLESTAEKAEEIEIKEEKKEKPKRKEIIIRNYHMFLLGFYLAGMYGLGSQKPVQKGIDYLCNQAGKGAEIACNYAKKSFNGLKTAAKNPDVVGYIIKEGKSSVENTAKKAPSLFQGYIDEKVEEDLRKEKKK